MIKSIAADPNLLQHRGPAVVFNDYPEMKAKIHDPELNVTAESVLILRSAGPLGAPGFPEWGMLPIPEATASRRARQVRLSDARMSGTSYGTCVLHIAPGRQGWPPALVETGDEIEINVPERTIHWHVSDEEIEKRRAAPRSPNHPNGYQRMYAKHVTQADQGCDFDFLTGRSPGEEPSIH